MDASGFYQRIRQQTQSNKGKVPPVTKWNPDLSGDIDIVIDAQGQWFHAGSPVKRQALVDLFSSILKREGDDYFLVTPVEKWRIQVAVAPLLMVALDVQNRGTPAQYIRLQTQQLDWISLDEPDELSARLHNGRWVPIMHVRDNLHALIDRNVYYHLAELAVTEGDAAGMLGTKKPAEADTYGVVSAGRFFPLLAG